MKRNILIVIGCLAWLSCVRRRDQMVFQNKGSDTMVNLSQAWAESYRKVKSNVVIAVTGGGSGTGIASLMNNTVDLANSSRPIKQEEMDKAKSLTGKEIRGNVVALDALTVIVHKDNPLKKISLEELACIYGEDGKCSKWGDLQIKSIPGCPSLEIVRLSRQSNSGTYQYFREAILGEKKDFKLGSRDLHGSKDVVDLVEKTPCSIGYTGMGYITSNVTPLCISKKKGSQCVVPNEKTAMSRTYPIARELFMYTLGEPTGELSEYLQWIKGPEGRKIIIQTGYVPLSAPGNS